MTEKIAIQTGIDLEIMDPWPFWFGRRRESPRVGQVNLVLGGAAIRFSITADVRAIDPARGTIGQFPSEFPGDGS